MLENDIIVLIVVRATVYTVIGAHVSETVISYCFYAKVCRHDVCIPRCVQYGSVLHIAQV